jgi:preprotein translocase subunit YajC
MQASLSIGDEVVLTSGIHGLVRGVDNDVAQVEVATGVTIRVARAAIGIVLRPDTDALPDPGEQET